MKLDNFCSVLLEISLLGMASDSELLPEIACCAEVVDSKGNKVRREMQYGGEHYFQFRFKFPILTRILCVLDKRITFRRFCRIY